MKFTENSDQSSIIISISDKNNLTFSFENLKSLRDEPYFDNCSDIFLHLKTQYSDQILNDDFYPLSRFINEKIIDHEINWTNTFSVLEKENFAQVYRNREDELDEIDVLDNILGALNHDQEINEEIDDPNFRNALIEGVRQQLITEDIIEDIIED